LLNENAKAVKIKRYEMMVVWKDAFGNFKKLTNHFYFQDILNVKLSQLPRYKDALKVQQDKLDECENKVCSTQTQKIVQSIETGKDTFSAYTSYSDCMNPCLAKTVRVYNPSENVTVDERLYPFKGRCQFRQYMPKKPSKYGIKFWVACCSKSKNKNVMVLRNMHNDNQVCDGKGIKPDIILHYNITKGGVDNLDKMTSTYSCQRMTARWPLVIFYNIIDVCAYNAYVLWTEKHLAWNVGRLHKRRLFLEELVKALVQPELMRRKTLPRTAAAISAVKRLRKDTEQPSTSGITDTDTGGKKRTRCQFCVSSDNKTGSQYERKTNRASPMGQFDPEDKVR
ncbi:PiggyBac transposable element-derived protein 4, partial [Trichinella sp. T6]